MRRAEEAALRRFAALPRAEAREVGTPEPAHGLEGVEVRPAPAREGDARS